MIFEAVKIYGASTAFQRALNLGAKPLKADNDGRTVMHFAAQSGNSKIITLLLKKFSSLHNIRLHQLSVG
jgi:ankyrin repeat protein